MITLVKYEAIRSSFFMLFSFCDVPCVVLFGVW